MTDAAFCSLTGARTYIDTNLAHVDSIFAGNVPRYLMGEDARGVAVADLPDVLHEAVHHWCFNSPVGMALTLLRTELTEVAFQTVAVRELAERYGRYSTALQLLRPLLEGIACFAEFDAYPGAGNLRADPFSWLGALAFPRESYDPETLRGIDPDEGIKKTFRELRLLEQVAMRRDNLLTQCLDPAAQGGYLTGYMLVKGAQAKTAEHSALAGDGELWMCFLRGRVLYDLELANLLLEPEPEGDDVLSGARSVAGRIEVLIEELTRPVELAASLEDYNSVHAADFEGDRTRADYLALGKDPAELERYRRQQDVHWDRISSPSDDAATDVMRRLAATTLANRDWICIASMPGAVKAGEDGRCFFTDADGMPRFAVSQRAASEHPFRDYSGPAAQELWIGPRAQGALLIIASEVGVHGWTGIWGESEPRSVEFLRSARSGARLLELTAIGRQAIDELFAAQPVWPDVEEYLGQIVAPSLEKQALHAVELFDGGERGRAALWEEGFFGVFRSYELLQIVSAYGLFRSLGDDLDDAIRDKIPEHLVLQASVDGILHGLHLTDYAETDIFI